jgi:hypothetical protein
MGLKRGPLSLVSTIGELVERKSSGSCLENRDYGHRDPLSAKLGTIRRYTAVGIVRWRTQATKRP